MLGDGRSDTAAGREGERTTPGRAGSTRPESGASGGTLQSVLVPGAQPARRFVDDLAGHPRWARALRVVPTTALASVLLVLGGPGASAVSVASAAPVVGVGTVWVIVAAGAVAAVVVGLLLVSGHRVVRWIKRAWRDSAPASAITAERPLFVEDSRAWRVRFWLVGAGVIAGAVAVLLGAGWVVLGATVVAMPAFDGLAAAWMWAGGQRGLRARFVRGIGVTVHNDVQVGQLKAALHEFTKRRGRSRWRTAEHQRNSV